LTRCATVGISSWILVLLSCNFLLFLMLYIFITAKIFVFLFCYSGKITIFLPFYFLPNYVSFNSSFFFHFNYPSYSSPTTFITFALPIFHLYQFDSLVSLTFLWKILVCLVILPPNLTSCLALNSISLQISPSNSVLGICVLKWRVSDLYALPLHTLVSPTMSLALLA